MLFKRFIIHSLHRQQTHSHSYTNVRQRGLSDLPKDTTVWTGGAGIEPPTCPTTWATVWNSALSALSFTWNGLLHYQYSRQETGQFFMKCKWKIIRPCVPIDSEMEKMACLHATGQGVIWHKVNRDGKVVTGIPTSITGKSRRGVSDLLSGTSWSSVKSYGL